MKIDIVDYKKFTPKEKEEYLYSIFETLYTKINLECNVQNFIKDLDNLISKNENIQIKIFILKELEKNTIGGAIIIQNNNKATSHIQLLNIKEEYRKIGYGSF